MPDIFVQSFTHLNGKPNADRALQLLQRIASLVKPIMRKHAWVLPVLSEFFPEDPTLLGLNVNHGEKIFVRLRSPHEPAAFLPEESIVGTLLHELTHNVHGPHDVAFYRFLSGLEDEYDALRRSGWSGEGFHSAGHRVGANVSHNLPSHLARAKAAQAAEKRRQVSVGLGSGGRLGGTSRRPNMTLRELAVEAAERRARDELTCASTSGPVEQTTLVERAADKSVRDEVIDLTGESTSDSESEPHIIETPPSFTVSPASSSSALSLPAVTRSAPASTTLLSSSTTASTSSFLDPDRMTRPIVKRVPHGAGDSQPKLPKPRSASRHHTKGIMTPATPTPPPTRSGSVLLQRRDHKARSIDPDQHLPSIPLETEWACPRCTLVNDVLALQCAACLGVRPPPQVEPEHQAEEHGNNSGSGWTCGVCGEREMPHDFWSCQFCGSVKVAS